MAILDQCEKFFKTRDIYQLLGINKDALPKDIKKAYYKLSLQVHPDRVSEKEKGVATEKFKILSKIYQVLTDKDKKAVYDEQGIIDDDDIEGKLINWLDFWRTLFKPITTEEISNFEKSYIGSDTERRDIKKAYLSSKGCINKMMNLIPFMQVKDEPRIQEIVREMIDAGDVPEYEIFTKEPAQKRNRRHKKYELEAKEAEKIKEKLLKKNESSNSSLEQQIMARQKSRAENFNSVLDNIMQKYGDEDDSEAVDFSSFDKKNKKTKKNLGAGAAAKKPAVKSGRVTKPKK